MGKIYGMADRSISSGRAGTPKKPVPPPAGVPKRGAHLEDEAPRPAAKPKGSTKKTGTFDGKSNALGHGGRAAQLKAKGVPGGVIGDIAREERAAPGQKNFHGR